MARVKRGTIKAKRRRNILSQVRGYRFGRGTKERQAKDAIAHAGVHAFAHRHKKKRDFRRLWNIRINAAVRPYGFSYNKFIHVLKKKNISIDRKILAELAKDKPEVFERIVKKIS